MLHSKVGERVEVKLHTGLSKKEFRTLKQRNSETFFLFQFLGALVLFFSSMDPHVKTALSKNLSITDCLTVEGKNHSNCSFWGIIT